MGNRSIQQKIRKMRKHRRSKPRILDFNIPYPVQKDKGLRASKPPIVELASVQRIPDTIDIDGCTLSLAFRLPDNDTCRCRFYCNPTKTCWVIVQENISEGTERISITYGDRVRAVDVFAKGRVLYRT